MTAWTFDPSQLSALADGTDIQTTHAAPDSWSSLQRNGTGTIRKYGSEMHLQSATGTNEFAQARRSSLTFARLSVECAFTQTPAPGVESRVYEFRSSTGSGRAAYMNIDAGNRLRLFNNADQLLHHFATDLDGLTDWRLYMGVEPGTTTTNGKIHSRLYTSATGTTAAEVWEFDDRNAGLTSLTEFRLGWVSNVVQKLQVRYVRMEDATLAPIGPLSSGASIDLGADRSVEALDTVNLTATTVSGTPSTYTWRQASGPAVTLTGTGNTRSFTAPATFNGGVVVIGCTPDGGSEDLVSITVAPTPSWVRLPGQTDWLPSRREQVIVW